MHCPMQAAIVTRCSTFCVHKCAAEMQPRIALLQLCWYLYVYAVPILNLISHFAESSERGIQSVIVICVSLPLDTLQVYVQTGRANTAGAFVSSMTGPRLGWLTFGSVALAGAAQFYYTVLHRTLTVEGCALVVLQASRWARCGRTN